MMGVAYTVLPDPLRKIDFREAVNKTGPVYRARFFLFPDLPGPGAETAGMGCAARRKCVAKLSGERRDKEL